MTPATTAELTLVHERLTEYVRGHFRRKLTRAEAEDVAAEALAEADRAQRDEPIADLDRWLRRAAWRNALDQIRRHEGEAKAGPRQRAIDIDDPAVVISDGMTVDELVADQDAARHDTELLAGAWETLEAREQRVLHLRLRDELDVPAICKLLGVTRNTYENLTKRALRKLRDALVADVAGQSCRDTRGLVIQAQTAKLSRVLVARRDAHLHSCLSCRAFDRRARKLLGTLPPPAGLIGAGTTTAGGAAVAATASGGAAAGGTLAAGGSLAGVAKLAAVVCAGGALTAAACVPITAITGTTNRRSIARTAATHPRAASSTRITQPASPARSAPLSTAVVTTTIAATTTATASSAAAQRKKRAASPFTPESAAAPTRKDTQSAPRITRYGTPAPAASSASATPASATTTTTRSTSGGSDFASEFTP